MYKLHFNEAPFNLSGRIMEAFTEKLKVTDLNRYGSFRGENLTEKLSEKLGLSLKNIAVGNGSDELLKVVTETFLSPGEKAMTISPHFVVYPEYVSLVGGEFISFDLSPDLTLDENGFIEQVIVEDPKIIYLCTPHNPTGLVLTPAFIKKVTEVSSGIVVIDEAYIEFSTESTLIDLAAKSPKLICTRTFSKAYGAAGIRLGYIVGSRENIKKINSRRLIFCLSTLTEVMGGVLLDNEESFRENTLYISEERDRILDEVVSSEKITLYPSQGSFILVKTSVNLGKVMKANGIMINKVAWREGFYRISIGDSRINNQVIQILNSL